MKINSARSRIRAALVNSGGYDFKGAENKLAAMRLHIHLENDAAATPAGQSAALTAVLTGARCFASVALTGRTDAPLLCPLPFGGRTIGDAAKKGGAKLIADQHPARLILIGDGMPATKGRVRAIWNGWSAGIAPGESRIANGRGDCALAGIAAGALAVGQCFLAELNDPRAGKRVQGLSLWSLDAGQAWWDDAGPAFEDVFLPDALWLVGLGNLGQAFLWSLTWCPYEDPARLLLFLQDDDEVREENWGTSVLVRRGRYGLLKTKVAEEWALKRGFRVRRVDRRLDAHTQRADTEPGIALGGLDSMPPRRLLGLPGFEYIIDAGLGAEAHDYHRLRVNVFDRDHDPAAHFAGVEDNTAERVAALKCLDAYREHERKSKDGGCGTAELAGQSVAVPFVSAVAGAISISQAIRITSNQPPYASTCGTLNDLRSLAACQGSVSERMTVGGVKAGRVARRDRNVRRS